MKDKKGLAQISGGYYGKGNGDNRVCRRFTLKGNSSDGFVPPIFIGKNCSLCAHQSSWMQDVPYCGRTERVLVWDCNIRGELEKEGISIDFASQARY